jgi:hypothetical protein
MTEPSKRGQNGGNARKEKLSPERRKEIAKEAAKKRWAKKDNPQPVDGALYEDGIHAENMGLEPTVYPTYGGIERDSMPIVEKNINPPSVPFQAVPVTINPAVLSPTPIQHAPEPPKPPKTRRKPMVKEFGKAHSYAEKRLAEAIKERAEAMGKVAMLNAEIPSLVQIIRALGMTPNMNGFQDFTASIPNMNPYQQPQYQQPQVAPVQDNNPIDPALYATNANPVPGLAPAVANAPLVTDKPMGGAIDLDFTPVEDEGPPLPRMGGGWV